MNEKIFVYGTLRLGMYNYDQYLKDKNSFRQFAYVKGKLMTLKGKNYPALLLEGSGMVRGEIHEVDSKFIGVLDDLKVILVKTTLIMNIIKCFVISMMIIIK